MLKHFERSVVLAYNSVTQRTDGYDVCGSSPDHHLRFSSDGYYFNGFKIDSNDRRLGKHDALALDVDKAARSSEVDSNILS
jgi:hypothetical protein